MVGPLVRVGPQVEQLRDAQFGEGLGPDPQRAFTTLLEEDDLPVVEPQRGEIAVVVHIEEVLPRALGGLPGQVRQLVVSVQMDLVGGAVQSAPLRSRSAISGTPAADSSVINQSLWLTMPVNTFPAGMRAGQRTIAGTR